MTLKTLNNVGAFLELNVTSETGGEEINTTKHDRLMQNCISADSPTRLDGENSAAAIYVLTTRCH